MTIKILAELLIRSIVGSFLGIIISLIFSIFIISLLYDFTFNDVKHTLFNYQYGLAIAYVIVVVLVFIEQIVKVKRQKQI
jgi:ABC-type antimicrobial peptide transport system permease subunit